MSPMVLAVCSCCCVHGKAPHEMLSAVAQSLLDLVFPPRCVHCHAPGAILCPSCFDGIVIPHTPQCEHCGRSLSPAVGRTLLCPSCASGHAPMSLTSLRAAAQYEGIAREAVLALKYAGRRRLAEPLGDLLAASVLRDHLRPDLVLPVPLHRERQRQRGYNQAELLARRCAWRLGVPFAAGLLLRQRPTAPQVGLTAMQRRVNVEGAFALAAGADAKLSGRQVLLIDDVTTTGSTLDAAATAILPARPAIVWGLAVTRPDLSDDGGDRGGVPGVHKHSIARINKGGM